MEVQAGLVEKMESKLIVKASCPHNQFLSGTTLVVVAVLKHGSVFTVSVCGSLVTQLI